MPNIGPLDRGDPDRLGPFRLAGRIGEGGQGVVYLGESATGERAAIKLLHVKFSGDRTARSRFARELRAAERVASFCTARVLAADLDGDTPYIASEYIDGTSLRETVEGSGPLSGSALQRLAVGTATALTAIHQAGIVHRDFKPDNVLMAADGPRVVDFGIARILDSTGTITSRAVGTPAYMAPEQISGGEVGPPADVFAWASTVMFAATGTAPFGGRSIAAVLNRVLNHEVDVEELSEPLRGVVRSCLHKTPDERPTADRILLRLLGHAGADGVDGGDGASTAVLSEGAEVASRRTVETARRAARAVPPAAAPPAAPAPAVPRRRSWRGRLVAAVLGLLVLGGGGAYAVDRYGLPFGRGGGVAAAVPSRTAPSPGVYSSVLDKVAATGRLTIAVRDLLPGVALLDNGEWGGFEVEVGRYIARRLGVPPDGVVFDAAGSAQRLAMLDSGQADLVIATYPIRAGAPITLAGPYYLAHVDLLVRQGDPFRRLGDLAGRRMCSPGSNASVGIVQDAVKVRLVSADNYADCMSLLREGKVDAVPGDDLLLAGFANRESIRYKVLGARLTDERYAVGVRRGDVETCEAVRDAVDRMWADGTAIALLRKYFGKVAFRFESERPTPVSCR
ncbi:hypothetical protein Sru01_05480 [Sphaerisporangium rufum]|uniref:Protein kinase domain-containing protein n=1 Tax=Sphaerisporangium rufum TaxID=1381558 RepID=A0A919UW04_9ACTN|nr:serine/threonine-protein kinase [Sphaerisporangium rufum]GII75566.1 hypothetical protein Sru01_05480 [Sphaerisporangium rufum]